jgi:hypothetical protein
MLLTLHKNTSVLSGEQLLIVHTIHYAVQFSNVINTMIMHSTFWSSTHGGLLWHESDQQYAYIYIFSNATYNMINRT